MGQTILHLAGRDQQNPPAASEHLPSGGSNSAIKGYIQKSSDKVLQDHHFTMSLKSGYETVRLSKSQTQVIPCIVSVKSDDDEMVGGKVIRYNFVDIVCVIDISGSMQGAKIQLVRQSLLYVVNQINENDRMALIVFSDYAQLLNGFTPNKKVLIENITALKATGGTNIKKGLEVAYDILKQKDTSGRVKALWLLSDGQDTHGFKWDQVDEHFKSYLKNCKSEFSTNSLGYGQDHDAKLLKSIAKIKGGKFTFIENNEGVTRGMANFLGRQFSAIAKKISIKVTPVQGKLLPGIRIVKGFGDSVRYSQEEGAFYIEIYQYRAGSCQSYVFEIEIPRAQSLKKEDYGDLVDIFKAEATITTLNRQSRTLVQNLKVRVQHPDQLFKAEKCEVEVLQNHCRVRVVEILKQLTELLQRRDRESAKVLIKSALEILKQAPPSDKINELKDDVDKISNKLNSNDFSGGYYYAMGQERFHGECEYYVGQERFQSLNIRNRNFMPFNLQEKDYWE